MPSQGHGVQDQMTWTNKELPQNKLLLKDFDDDDYIPSYHLFANDSSLKYATFDFSEEMVPVGNSQEKCVYFEYAASSQKQNSRSYIPLLDLPDCSNAKTGLWSENDPKIGVAVPSWIQHSFSLSCSGKSCTNHCEKKGGIWVEGVEGSSGNCYTYEILSEICVKVERIVDIYDKVKFRFDGGCFEKEMVGKYIQAKPRTVYRFSNVPILLRSNSDPFMTVTQSHSKSKSTSNHLLNLVAFLLMLVALVTGAFFGVEYKKVKASGEGYREHP
jgi:hypothetical protein